MRPTHGRTATDRKAVGERILGLAAQVRRRGTMGRQTLGAYYGFDLELSGYEVSNGDRSASIETSLGLIHSGEQRGFEVSEKTRWNSLIGKIEASIRNLDSELAGVRASLEADERRLPAFEARLGQDFPDEALLEDKLRELAELEADLANTKGEFDDRDRADEAEEPGHLRQAA